MQLGVLDCSVKSEGGGGWIDRQTWELSGVDTSLIRDQTSTSGSSHRYILCTRVSLGWAVLCPFEAPDPCKL